MISNPRTTRRLLMTTCLLVVVLQAALPEPSPIQNVDIGIFIKLSRDDFQALDAKKGYEAALLRDVASKQVSDPLGMTLASMCFELLSTPGAWKGQAGSGKEIVLRGSSRDFQPVPYSGDFPDIVSAFYTFDGKELSILPFHLKKESASATILSGVSGGISDLEDLTAAISRDFQESLLGRPLSEEELQPTSLPGNPAAPPTTFKFSTQLEWGEKNLFRSESVKFSSALSRFVASISLSALSAGTYFLYSEAYSRSATDIGKVYASGGAAIVFLAASAAFAVESIIRLSRLLKFSR